MTLILIGWFTFNITFFFSQEDLPIKLDVKNNTIQIKSAVKILFSYVKYKKMDASQLENYPDKEKIREEMRQLLSSIGPYFLFEYTETTFQDSTPHTESNIGFYPMKPDLKRFDDIFLALNNNNDTNETALDQICKAINITKDLNVTANTLNSSYQSSPAIVRNSTRARRPSEPGVENPPIVDRRTAVAEPLFSHPPPDLIHGILPNSQGNTFCYYL